MVDELPADLIRGLDGVRVLREQQGRGRETRFRRVEECEGDKQCVDGSLGALAPPPGGHSPGASGVPAAFSIHRFTPKRHKPLCLVLALASYNAYLSS